MERALRKYEGANHLTSYEKACAKATSIIYLLREGPALIDRLDLFAKCGQGLMKSTSPSKLNPNTKVFVPSFLATNTLCQEESSTESSAQICFGEHSDFMVPLDVGSLIVGIERGCL